jgi:hypothetical protein
MQSSMVPSNRKAMFCLLSVPTCYKQEELVEWRAECVTWLVNQSVSELEDCCGSVFVSCCCEKLVAEARDSW